ncbi:alpha/beta fold hydrolase [Natronospirillum operosum]|uniref:Alpha/beta fold hydrolase n=1 Tax=Natronospirillum operosum TaxID=2759953 RepID=A0A4Z0WAS0_9GAMM|nr:alpha/beta fold hydrolase [Natronospirillum operosum]TGG91511.1 alpha/beta fold hydrolase [Natronospirillum operosum]
MTDFDWQWTPASDEARGCIVICHGMAEHHRRYDAFARYLAERGWHVLTYDHPGHGAGASTLGDLGPSGWNAVTDRLTVMLAHAADRAPGLPLWILGHSMGSFAVLDYATSLTLPDTCRGLVLVGPDSPQTLPTRALQALTGLLKWRQGASAVSPLVQKLTFGQFNRSVASARTESDWICGDPAVVDAYLDDPLCGFACSVGLWHELSQVLLRLARNSTLQRLPAGCQVLIMAGGRDPVGRFGKGPRTLAHRLRQHGPGAELKLYPTLRHEILNEKDKALVWADVQKMVADFTAH